MEKTENFTKDLRFTQDTIIKVSGQTTKTFVGYNLFSGEFMEVEKDKTTWVPEGIFQMLIPEFNRFKLADIVAKGHRGKVQELFGCCDRSVYRKYTQYRERLEA